MKETSPDSKEDSGLIRDELLHELFESTAERCPGRTAVQCGHSRLTYAELDAFANRLAHALHARGVGCEDRVGIFLPRSENVYVAMLAILKAGAAYVPLDPETPPERVRFILQDSGAKCLITLSGMANALDGAPPVLRLDVDRDEIADQPSTRLTRGQTGASRDNLCYVIYTSGTTGQPKGVLIEHRNVTHLVRAESQLYGIVPEDRVFQFSSVAFDASVEEIWMAFFHGATLVVGTPEIIHSGSEFSLHLERLGVTVLSCVPTFLLMLDRDIATVRLLILGGEVCPPGLADRWQRPGRITWNTYGPTETTVIATAAVLLPHKPVTIGRAIANYQIFLMDEGGHPVPNGLPGEICIGGEGVGRGYLNRPEIEKQKFIMNGTLGGRPIRLYRTADRARLTPDGELEYLGRLDDQVKLRGFRIELSEIEAVINQEPGVLAAAATVHQPTQQIVAYIVPQSPQGPDRFALRRRLVDRLPKYMVPAFLDELPALPMTDVGKIDRQRLPEPRTPLLQERRARQGPRTEAERVVIEVWQSVLKREDIAVRDDFFLDLDGHSLLAAAVVSKLRGKPGFERLSLADLYARPTAEALAQLACTKEPPVPRMESPFRRVSNLCYRLCAAGQAVGIFFIAGLYAWQWLGAYLAYGYLAVEDWPVHRALTVALLVLCAVTPATLLLSIGVKWLLLGRLRPGRHPLWGWFYWRFWFVRAVVRAAPVQYLDGTPLLNLYYRLMGARIGPDVFIGSHGLATFDLLTVGAGTSIGLNTSIDGSSVEGGYLTLGPVTIGQRCWVGNRCALGAHSVLEDGAGLDDLSMLPDGGRVPSGELWRGSPAVPGGRLESEPARPPWNLASLLYHTGGIVLFPIIIVGAVLPGLMAITHLGHLSEGYEFLLASPLVAVTFVVFLSAELWLLKWLVIGRLRPGCYPVGGFFYARKWFLDQLMTMSADVTESLYETLYAAPWLRALGARIGARCEIAAVELVHPDLLEMGPESMIADLAMLGAPQVRSGRLIIGPARMGRRVFIGNSAVLPAGSDLGDRVLLGLMSLPPKNDGGPVADGSSWFGSPAIRLPMRYYSGRFSESETFVPPKRLVALRMFIELFRIFLPGTIFVMLASLLIDTTDILQDHLRFRSWLMVLPLLYVVAGILGVLATALIKWMVVGRYRAGERPLWSGFVWRNDLINGVYSNFCEHFFLGMLRGTPFVTWALRALGMKIGRHCYVDTTWFTEFDLINLGDDVALNDSSNLQTHLFEDRVIKMGSLRLGDRCVVGAMSTVLYNTQMEPDASLEDLSLLMKGETLPAATRWRGIPAQRTSP
jgi:non-ribosomal peptide synthetase-like protein